MTSSRHRRSSHRNIIIHCLVASNPPKADHPARSARHLGGLFAALGRSNASRACWCRGRRMSIPVLNPEGVLSGEAAFQGPVAEQEIKPHLIHETVVSELGQRRAGTHSTKNRGEVRGGGAEAVASEGHRPGATGLEPRAALAWRWRDLRSHPAQPRRQGQPKGAGAGVPGGAPSAC